MAGSGGAAARRRTGRRRARARLPEGPVSGVPALDPLLSEEGWAYASLPPQEPGDPGRFHALFGRDSLICALQVLPAAPEVARATLRALAARQGTRTDPETDEEPGKILHEFRTDPGAWFVEGGWPVRDDGLLYYGSADSTSWFLIVLGATGDAALAAELEPAWRAAGGWLAGALEAGGGLVRYGPRRSTGGLEQQGWRDAIGPVEQPSRGRGDRARGRERARPTRWPTRTPRRPRWPRSTRSRGWIPRGGWAARGGGAAGAARRLGRGRMALEGDGTPVPGAGSQLGWLLWARALEGDAAAAAADRLVAPGRADPLRPAHAVGGRGRVRPAGLPPRRRLAVRLLARLGRPARCRPPRRGRARAVRRARGAGPARAGAGALRRRPRRGAPAGAGGQPRAGVDGRAHGGRSSTAGTGGRGPATWAGGERERPRLERRG